MKQISAYPKLNSLVCIVYLSTDLYHLFKALKRFGSYIMLNAPKCILW